MRTNRNRQRGAVSILAILFVALFAVLATSFTAMSSINLQTSQTHRNIAQAQAAAESGLAYAHHLVDIYLSDHAIRTLDNVVTDDSVLMAFRALTVFSQDHLTGLAILQGQSVPRVASFTEGERTGLELSIPAVPVDAAGQATFSLQLRLYGDDPQAVAISSTGTHAGVTRVTGMQYDTAKDTSLLDFAIASRSPINITDDSTIGVGVYSEWSTLDVAPPVTLAGISTINGDISTMLSENDFADAGMSFPDELPGTYQDIQYSEPQLDLPTADDFDTSSYVSGTSVLSVGHTTRVDEYYPHAPGDYSTPVEGSVSLNRVVYENKVIRNKRLPSGNNALFINCTFEGDVFYLGSTGGIGANNVRFENCTFNCPIITGVPPQFGPEDWKKNALYFTGETVFNNDALDEATILAPNYNVDIGNISSDSALTGLVVGGVVDIRGDATIDGTILSMADPLELGDQAGQLDTSVGISDAGGSTITITPTPQRLLPIGVSTKVLLVRDGNSYLEL